MKIDSIKAQSVYESYAAGTRKSNKDQADSAVSGNADKLELSAGASALRDSKAIAKQTAASTEEGREARIQSIKNRIESGDYSVSAKDVAGSIIKGSVFDIKA